MERNKMKEIIYLDTDIINSLLAQLEQGIVNNYAVEETTATSESSGSSTDSGVDSGLETAVNLGLAKFNLKNDSRENESQISSVEVTEGQKDLLNKQFHDYSLDILMNKLNKENLIKEKDFQEGDLIQTEGEFIFYDFSLISTASDPETWKEMISWEEKETSITKKEAKRIYDKLNKGQTLTKKEEKNQNEALLVHKRYMEVNDISETMGKLEKFSSTTDKLFKNLTFTKTDNLIGLLKKEFLRESSESLSFRGKNTRKAQFLGRVIGVKNEIVDGSNLERFSPQEINRIPNMLLDILLGSFKILEIDDILISPIAVYYESN